MYYNYKNQNVIFEKMVLYLRLIIVFRYIPLGDYILCNVLLGY